MGTNRTRRLFGRRKRTRGPHAEYTLYGFRPRRYHFLSPLFRFIIVRGRENYISVTLIDTFSISEHAGTNQGTIPPWILTG